MSAFTSTRFPNCSLAVKTTQYDKSGAKKSRRVHRKFTDKPAFHDTDTGVGVGVVEFQLYRTVAAAAAVEKRDVDIAVRSRHERD